MRYHDDNQFTQFLLLFYCHFRYLSQESTILICAFKKYPHLHNLLVAVFLLQFSRSAVSYSLWPHESQHTRSPCPSPTPRVYPNSCPSSWWCHPAISTSVVPFSSCPQSLPASGSFPVSQLFTWCGQSIGVSASASFLPKKSQGWSPLGWTDPN